MIARGVRRLTGHAGLGLVVCAMLTALVMPAGAQVARPWPSEGPPGPLEARPITFPPYQITTLDNGLTVVVVTHHEQPAVSVRMIVRAGAAQDPTDKLGVAMLTATLLDQGAAGRTAAQIADAIDFVGGILGTGAGTDLSFVNAVVMKDSLPLALELIADVVRRPTFAATEIDRQRQQALSALTVAVEDPSTVAGQVIDRLVYGFHPYGMPGTGTPESLTSLTREDVVAFHDRYYVPNNALVAIVGDVTVEEATAGVKASLGDWERQDVPAFSPIEPPPPTKRVVVIDRPGAVQTEIRVGHLAIPRKHESFEALDQASKILGGEGANRLQQVLRTQRGLTYGASADLETFKSAGALIAETSTRSDATAEALRVIVDEFWRLQRERVYPAELQGAQAYLVGQFPLTIETPDAIATQVLNQLFYELPLEELEDYREIIESVSPDDVQRVARAFFKPDRLSVVLVGNADAFVEELKGAGFGDYERIPIDELDLLEADLRRNTGPTGGRRQGGARPGSPIALSLVEAAGGRASYAGGDVGTALARLRLKPPSPWLRLASGSIFLPRLRRGGSLEGRSKSVADLHGLPAIETLAARAQTADAVIAKAVEARGGLQAMRSLTSLIADAQTTLMTPDGEVEARTRTFIAYPDQVRVEADVRGATIVQVYDAGDGWLQDPGGVRDAPPEMLREFRASAQRDPHALLLGAASGELETRLLPEEGVEGRVLQAVEVSGEGLPPVRLYIDGNTGHIERMVYQSSVQGASETEEVFGDYRTVDGRSVPFEASVRRDGRVMLEREVTQIQFNADVAASLFTRPR